MSWLHNWQYLVRHGVCSRLLFASACRQRPMEAVRLRYSQLHRRSVQLVQELDHAVRIPRPLDIDLLLDRLEQHRQRPIELVEAVTTSDGPCGMWIEQSERDVIMYAARTSPLHQRHIIAHEIGHMIAGHQGDCALTDLAEQLGPAAPDPTLIKHMLGRSAYANAEEMEAEMIANLIFFTAAEPAGLETEIPAKSHRLAWIEETFGASQRGEWRAAKEH